MCTLKDSEDCGNSRTPGDSALCASGVDAEGCSLIADSSMTEKVVVERKILGLCKLKNSRDRGHSRNKGIVNT